MCNPIFSDEDADLRLHSYRFDKHGYARRTINGGPKIVTVFAHHEVCERAFGRRPNWGKLEVTDHINRDKLDNRRINLRIVSLYENNQNRAKPNRNTARYATSVGNRWQSQVSVNGRSKYIGLFRTAEEANQAALSFLNTHAREVQS